MRLSDRVAAVTGASSGLGAAIAAALAAEGAAVAGYARRFRGAARRPEAGRILEVGLDVTDEAAVRDRFAAVGPIDILVSAAGAATFAPVVDVKVADLRTMLEVHVVGAFLCAREVLRQPRPAHPRHIVHVSSAAAFKTFPAAAGYTAAKEGQRGLTRILVEEARAQDIRVTGLYPGAVDTPLWDDRPEFDRSAMLTPRGVAGLVVEIVTRPELALEEILVMPPKGAL